ncbi:unnamed protein product, partial [Urochloa humidicola]
KRSFPFSVHRASPTCPSFPFFAPPPSPPHLTSPTTELGATHKPSARRQEASRLRGGRRRACGRGPWCTCPAFDGLLAPCTVSRGGGAAPPLMLRDEGRRASGMRAGGRVLQGVAEVSGDVQLRCHRGRRGLEEECREGEGIEIGKPTDWGTSPMSKSSASVASSASPLTTSLVCLGARPTPVISSLI